MRITNNRGSTGRPFTTSPGRLSAGDPQGGARAENAKSLPFGLPNSIDLKIWRQLKPYSNRLTRLKVETARKKFRREVESETNKLYIGKRGDANSKAVPNTRLNIILQETNEFLEQQYSIFRDVWLKLGGSESAAFIRTISAMVIQLPFGARTSSFVHAERMRFRRGGGLQPMLSEEHVRKRFENLRTEWRDKLEIKALEWEAEVQGSRLISASQISSPPEGTSPKRGPTRPKPLCFASAVDLVSRNPELTLVQFCRIMDRKAEQFPRSQKYLPPKTWKVASFMEQYRNRSNTVSRFLSDVRKVRNSLGS
jgi:hypothetical protein